MGDSIHFSEKFGRKKTGISIGTGSRTIAYTMGKIKGILQRKKDEHYRDEKPFNSEENKTFLFSNYNEPMSRSTGRNPYDAYNKMLITEKIGMSPNYYPAHVTPEQAYESGLKSGRGTLTGKWSAAEIIKSELFSHPAVKKIVRAMSAGYPRTKHIKISWNHENVDSFEKT